jgi:DNA polymerase III alpha subunit
VYATFVNAIISVGVLSGKGESRSKMLYEFDTWQKLTDKEKEWCVNNYSSHDNLLDLLRTAQPTKKQGGGTHNVKRSGILCDLIQQLENPCYSLDDDPEWIIREEENYLGVPITYSRVDSSDTSRANATCKDIINGRGGKVKLGVTVSAIRKYITKKGDEMAFLSVEDSTGSIDNITIFHDQWSEYKNILYENNNVLIIGKKEDVKKDGIIVEKVLEI